MSEITVTFDEAEARALLPHGPMGEDGWNRRLDLAEDAQAKIRRALREQGAAPQPKEQATLLGDVA